MNPVQELRAIGARSDGALLLAVHRGSGAGVLDRLRNTVGTCLNVNMVDSPAEAAAYIVTAYLDPAGQLPAAVVCDREANVDDWEWGKLAELCAQHGVACFSL